MKRLNNIFASHRSGTKVHASSDIDSHADRQEHTYADIPASKQPGRNSERSFVFKKAEATRRIVNGLNPFAVSIRRNSVTSSLYYQLRRHQAEAIMSSARRVILRQAQNANTVFCLGGGEAVHPDQWLCDQLEIRTQ